MFKTRSLGKIFGVEVKIHGTFLFFLAFLALSGLSKGGLLSAGLSVFLTLIVFSVIVLHEFGHILAARKFGLSTKDVILSPLGGTARLQGATPSPRAEISIALAGPLVNAVLAGLGFALQQLLFQGSSLANSQHLGPLVLWWFIRINLTLLIFNLIPAIPMDGGRVLRAVLSRKMGHLKATQVAAKVARWSALAMAMYGVASGHYALLLIAGFIYLSSWLELAQASGGQLSRNFQFNFSRANPGHSGTGYPQQIVDERGQPVNEVPHSRIVSARWVDK